MNIIVVMMDTLRRDHLDCYGNKRITTPSVDALARENMVFARVVAESLTAPPLRRALLTGMRTFPFTKRFYSSADSAGASGSTNELQSYSVKFTKHNLIKRVYHIFK